jgi:hypothetical protein
MSLGTDFLHYGASPLSPSMDDGFFAKGIILPMDVQEHRA